MSFASSLCGSEPIVGYRVTERLGAGGYGEVWKAEAPGGLHKAIKFIYGYLNDDKATRELKALNRIKQIRHPFLLSLERIEIVDGQLIIVTELADLSLRDRFHACQTASMASIERNELLGYLRDAADALDFLSANALQHLDVKPENLLLVGGRVKVADFGLVSEIKDHTCSMMGGMTPVYASPETFDGRPHANSDQYSLAIVYQEMLTGAVPFPGNTAAQLASQHLYSRPRLEALPESDRPIIAKALEKKPSDRFPNSRALIDALLAAGTSGWRNLAPAGDRSGGAALFERRPEDDSPARRTPAVRPRSPERAAETPAARPRLSTAVPFERHERGAVVDLPPLDVGAAAGLRPTLFLGIGGTAGHILCALRRRLTEQFGNLNELPLFQSLLIDTDTTALSQLAHAADSTSSAASTLLAMPLRKPQDYRAEAVDILHWLSRRWLYNIPRSLQTEGLRPLGRLALVDHGDKFFDAVRGALVRVTSETALAAGEQKSGLPLRDQSPRVFVVASVSGGTGSGMVLDVGYAVRMLLADMGLADDGLCGILTHCTNRAAAARELAVANAYACLSELDFYSRDGYPGEPSCRLPAFEHRQTPFAHTYFVHLGDELADREYQRAADAVAEYLFLDSATAAGGLLDQCRSARQTAGDEPTKLRTLGICRVGCQNQVLEMATDAVLKGLVGAWVGETRRKPDQPSVEAHLDPLVSELIAQCDLRTTTMMKRFHAELQQLLQPSPPIALQSFAATLLLEESIADAAPSQATSWQRLTTRARQSLGLAETDEEPGPLARLPRAVDAALARSSQDLGVRLEEFVKAVANQPGLRVPGARQACEKLIDRLRQLEADLASEGQRLAVQLDSLPQESRSSGSKSRWGARAKSDDSETPSLADQLVSYAKLLIEQMALGGAHRLVRALLARLSSTGESLVALGRELRHLGDGIHVAEAWSDALVSLPQQSQMQDVDMLVMRELRRCLPKLVTQLEKRVDEELLNRRGGLAGLVHCGSVELQAMVTVLKAAARGEVTQALKDIDVAAAVLGPQKEAASNQQRLEKFTRRAWPQALDCGGAKRLLLFVPDSPTAAQIPEMLADTPERPTVVVGSNCDIVACYEAEQLPLPSLASMLIDGDPQYADIARRLHTRTDVDWRPL